MESWSACCPLACHRNLNGDISIRTRRRGVVRGSVKHKRASTTPSVSTVATTRDNNRIPAMRVAVIFLACVVAVCTTQTQDGPKGAPIPIRANRYQRLPSRPGGTGSAFPNQRFRRPISFKPRGGPGDDASGTFRPLRPVAAPSFAPHVKPVNEEPEEENLSRDTIREDEDDQSQEIRSQDSVEDLSEEIPRAPNPPKAPPAASGQLAYRAPQVTPTNVRVSPTTPPPPPPVQYRPTPPPIQYRPTQKPTKAPRKQIIDDITFQQPIKPPPKPVKPSQAYEIRGKKPVAQIIRRYRHDNADGSITWGFENDDGSYKEETIGVDCITSGKYGYIDPDGIRREYTYEMGIKCDEQDREEEEDGFVDYQENKLVLPDGKTIDLSSMGKKQARRPQFQYRN
ncbi:PREDICTED: LOW QUALITY PROTEIN: uncharacterized protein DKFZp434B061-like [Atta colombica]|uniref:LOW QUALITY PROTEIN: uncharacterized protein DKFZp434B061-like n=1 Tax=Atta colombica TaxID=520822 RepID=UPI00084CCC2C|nr:PREDICTED: LOW QUALITY PROTEIN: uncharacterized protein DKFZp434B061-like [Atta colombica]